MSASGFEFSGLVLSAHDKDHYSLRYAEFVVPLVKGMQEQQQVIEKQVEEISDLKDKLQKQEQEVQDLQSEVSKLSALVEQLLAGQSQTPVQQLDLKRPAHLSQNHPIPSTKIR